MCMQSQSGPRNNKRRSDERREMIEREFNGLNGSSMCECVCECVCVSMRVCDREREIYIVSVCVYVDLV